MARQFRIQHPGAYYHVTSCGNARQDIYKDHRDYERFLNILSESLDIFNVSLLAYVCMTNHFHLFLTTPEASLAEFMQHFNITIRLHLIAVTTAPAICIRDAKNPCSWMRTII